MRVWCRDLLRTIPLQRRPVPHPHTTGRISSTQVTPSRAHHIRHHHTTYESRPHARRREPDQHITRDATHSLISHALISRSLTESFPPTDHRPTLRDPQDSAAFTSSPHRPQSHTRPGLRPHRFDPFPQAQAPEVGVPHSPQKAGRGYSIPLPHPPQNFFLGAAGCGAKVPHSGQNLGGGLPRLVPHSPQKIFLAPGSGVKLDDDPAPEECAA